MSDAAFKALGDPTRRAILRMLGEREMPAGEIARRFEASAPATSHHLAVLKAAGLIYARRSGQQLIYTLNTTVFQDLVRMVMDLAHAKEDEPPT